MSGKPEYLDGLRYMVQSDGGTGQQYLVDLEENNGYGKCGCPHFEFRIQPELDKGQRPARCKHLIGAMLQFSEETVRRIIETKTTQGKEGMATKTKANAETETQASKAREAVHEGE